MLRDSLLLLGPGFYEVSPEYYHLLPGGGDFSAFEFDQSTSLGLPQDVQGDNVTTRKDTDHQVSQIPQVLLNIMNIPPRVGVTESITGRSPP